MHPVSRYGLGPKKLFRMLRTDPKRAQFSSSAGCPLCEMAGCLSRSLCKAKAETFVKELRMLRLSSLRLAGLMEGWGPRS